MPPVIDLRSDTVTHPTDAMRRAMAAAPLGDDVFGDDPTVNALENHVAALFGHEAALFAPSGTMANQIALQLLVPPGGELLAGADAHVVTYEVGAAAALGGISTRTWPSDGAALDVDRIAAMIRPAGRGWNGSRSYPGSGSCGNLPAASSWRSARRLAMARRGTSPTSRSSPPATKRSLASRGRGA